MNVRLKKVFKFDAAHRLPHLGETHKCGSMHGHTYRVELSVEGEVDGEKGWLIDFGELKEVVEPFFDILDHTVLNQIAGLENPTAENLCRWLWERIQPRLPSLCEIVVWETDTSACICRGQ